MPMMLTYHGRFGAENTTHEQWIRVNAVIMQNMTPEIQRLWRRGGYEGLADECVLEHYGINRIYRDERQDVTFEFTPQQWTWFLIKWSGQ